MSIIIALIIVFVVGRAGMLLATLMVDAVATVIGLALFLRATRISRRVRALGRPDAIDISDFDRRPSRAELRLMAAGLNNAMHLTELRSLFPMTALRAERIAATLGC